MRKIELDDKVKKAQVIQFFVEMTEKDAMELAFRLDLFRHQLNQEIGWDISRSIPNYCVKKDD